MPNSPISNFLDQNFLHFNARELVASAKGWRDHLDGGGKMLVSLAGAMSTAELGISLAEMIRQDKVHAISCTGANLEEDASIWWPTMNTNWYRTTAICHRLMNRHYWRRGSIE